MKSLIITLSIALLFSCQNNAQQKTITKSNKSKIEQGLMTADPVEVPIQDGLARAYFASGCFWCVEAIFESLIGVKEAVSGYSGGKEINPVYEDVAYGRTSHAEAVEVYYDPKVISYKTLVTVFFASHDPTTLNRQGPDRGRHSGLRS